jgi:hypothetical protein
MAQVDRRDGVVDDLGIKRPVRCAATTNVTLSGLQTIDGIALVEGDRVLLTGQSTGSQNGIWVASTGNWTRPKDFDGALDCVRGTLVFVQVGSANARSLWQVDTPDPITIDSTPLAFVELVLATGNSTWSNTRLAKTANYTVANADKGVTLALGGNAFFTVTLNAASGHDANFAITIVNEDAGRGKRISPNGLTSFILWPKQTVRVFNQNNVWRVDPPEQRWRSDTGPTFHVHPTLGNDTNDGLAAGAGGAVQMIQQAFNYVRNHMDLALGGVTIQLADGTYTSGVSITSPPLGNTTWCTIQGNAPTPANVHVNVTGTAFNVEDYAGVTIKDMRITATVNCVSSRQYSIVDFANIEFGTCGSAQIIAVDTSVISAIGGYAIVGDSPVHVSAQAHSLINLGTTVTIASARAFTVFAATNLGVIAGTTTFTGAGVAGTTGQRFSVTNGRVDPSTTYPGNTAGQGTLKANADGSVGAPFWTWDSDADTGLYRAGANNPAMAAGGVQAQLWTSTGTTISGNTTLGDASTDTVTMNAKSITKPNFPAFQAFNSVLDANVTGDGTVATVDVDSELFDRGGDFASDTFTAPITGIYLFGGTIHLADIAAGHTDVEARLFVNGTTPFRILRMDPTGIDITGGSVRIPWCKLMSLSASNTVVLQVTVTGSTLTIDFGTDMEFWGYLVG